MESKMVTSPFNMKDIRDNLMFFGIEKEFESEMFSDYEEALFFVETMRDEFKNELKNLSKNQKWKKAG